MDNGSLSAPTRAWLAAGRHETVLGRRIFIYEKGSGPPLLFLHGFPTSCFDWRGVIDLLSGRFRCVAFDFPGYGLSDKPDDYSYSLFQQADHVEGIARLLGLERAHVVSHDMGTSVHCELLARAQRSKLPFGIAASTFTNGSMLMWLAKITPFQEILASNATLPRAMELCEGSLHGHAAALRSLMKRPEVWSAEDETVITDLLAHKQGNRRIPALAGYMRERYVHRERWLGALGGAGDAMQFIWGDGDPIARAEMGRELHRMFPAAPYRELAGIGHFIIAEDAASVAEGVAAFDPR